MRHAQLVSDEEASGSDTMKFGQYGEQKKATQYIHEKNKFQLL